MPDLTFRVDSAEPELFGASPAITFRIGIGNAQEGEQIHTVVLRAQIQIESGRRRYTPDEQKRLLDLFGTPDRWAQTLRPMTWTHAGAVAGAFTGSTSAGLSVPCTFDFNVAATKYFYGLDGGEIPLLLLFSGTVFYHGAGGALSVSPISWSKEARYRLPVKVWRDMMDHYYPNTAWLCLRRDVFDKLLQRKIDSGATSWEQAVEELLAAAGREEPVC